MQGDFDIPHKVLRFRQTAFFFGKYVVVDQFRILLCTNGTVLATDSRIGLPTHTH
jgi:hypothetical protein